MIAAACVAALAAVYTAQDGSDPSRAREHAEAVFHGTTPAIGTPPGFSRHTDDTVPVPTTFAAPLTIADLERQLAMSDPGARDLVLQDMLPALFAHDPERLARFAELQSDPALRELVIRQVALLWGAKDAERAVNWARALPDAAERDASMMDIANGLSSVDPGGAVQLREQFVGYARTDSALSNLVQQWAGFEFDAALAWTQARPPGLQRDDLLQRLIYVRAASGDPPAAAELVSVTSLSGEARIAAVASVTQEWVVQDRASAAEYLQTLDQDTSGRIRAALGSAVPQVE